MPAIIHTEVRARPEVENGHTTRRSSLELPDLLEGARDIASFSFENAAVIDQRGIFPEQEFARIAHSGLLVAPLATAAGGLGLGFEAKKTAPLLRLLQTLGKGNLSVGRIYEGHVNGLQFLQTFARPEQVELFARDAKADKIFGVWNAEAADGLKIHPLEDGKYRLTGCKTFCSGAENVQRPLVGGLLPDGKLQLCLIPMEQVRTRIEPNSWTATGMRGSVSVKIDFTGVVLDQKWLIGQPNDYQREPWLTLGVVRFAAVQLGGAEAVLDQTRLFLRKLKRTTDPYQLARVGQMTLAIETGRLWLENAARKISAYDPIFGGDPFSVNEYPAELTVYTNMVRTVVEQVAMEVMKHAERCIGSRGLLPPEPSERIIRDLRLYLRQPCFDAALAQAGVLTLSE